MQSLSWYRYRLMAMSPQEIAWRLRRRVRNTISRRKSQHTVPRCDQILNGAARRAIALVPSSEFAAFADDWIRTLRAQADSICEHRLSMFDMQEQSLGRPVKWNHEHKVDRPTPMTFGPDIDYRDFQVTGDCKIVWEPNRPH